MGRSTLCWLTGPIVVCSMMINVAFCAGDGNGIPGARNEHFEVTDLTPLEPLGDHVLVQFSDHEDLAATSFRNIKMTDKKVKFGKVIAVPKRRSQKEGRMSDINIGDYLVCVDANPVRFQVNRVLIDVVNQKNILGKVDVTARKDKEN